MAGPGRVHDRTILDALEALGSTQFHGEVWRIARKGRDALRGSAANGRWSPIGEFEVLYASLEREGALAEIGYRLSLEPIWPSRLEHQIHQIGTQIDRALRFADVDSLAPLGVDISRYETFEYGVTQAIAAAAHFLEYDGLIVPNARHPSSNLVVFMDRLGAGSLDVHSSEDVDWDAWRSAKSRGRLKR
jgi:RES domain-containing protein